MDLLSQFLEFRVVNQAFEIGFLDCLGLERRSRVDGFLEIGERGGFVAFPAYAQARR